MDKNGRAARPSNTKQDIEIELLKVLRLRQGEWTRASEENRDYARQRFMDALYVYDKLFHDK